MFSMRCCRTFCMGRTVQRQRAFSVQSKQESKFPQIIMSGIQPTGIPHVGNYLGAIRPWVEQQNNFSYGNTESQIYISIVDLHALTSIRNDNLGDRVLEMAACLIACGIDPNKTILFQQSKVRGHTELAWILSCLCTLPTISHQPQWKERSETWPADQLSLGLLSYPILQAADILLYRATHVPVGEDQIKHLELTRHLANRFHKRYCTRDETIFPAPRSVLVEDGTKAAKVCSLRNPAKKMSKSTEDERSRINLNDSDDEIHRKIRQSVTDSIPGNVVYDPDERTGVSNLIRLAASMSNKSIEEMCRETANLNKVQLKDLVSSVLIHHLTPIRQRIVELLHEERGELLKILKDGNGKAQTAADDTMVEVNRVIYNQR